MNIIEALKKTGKAMRPSFNYSAIYVKGVPGEAPGKVKFYWSENDTEVYFTKDFWFDDWLPYDEPVKCEACQTADEAEIFFNEKLSQDRVYADGKERGYDLATHLRKYHCTCPELPQHTISMLQAAIKKAEEVKP